MPVSAIKAQVTGNAQAAGAPKPKCHATQAERTPVVNSTKGYRTEILALQEAQRPRRSTQLISGMFCQALTGALQAGQAERGVLKVNCSGVTGVAAVSASPVAGSNSAACDRHSRSSIMGRR